MKSVANRIRGLTRSLSLLLEREQAADEALLSALMDSVRLIQGETADRRLQSVAGKLKALGERMGLLNELARRDYLSKIEHEVEALRNHLIDSRAAGVFVKLVRGNASSLNLFCETLLDLLIEATGAERGFVLFYVPESTEADVIAARNYQTRNLSLEEYDFSRTLLRDVLQRGEALLLEDASEDPAYSREVSVIKFELRSIIAAPLKQDGRTIGALYLENNSRPCAFDERDPALLQDIADFAVFYLKHSNLLPPPLGSESRVYFDEAKASKEIIGRHPKIIELLETVARLADSPATVLIEGESGTGKELIARALHYQSARSNRPFVAINCAAIPDNLLESELFGHEKGAFSGATGRYIGRIEQGDGGTIFLDEVSEMAYQLQAKLLRFLQSNEFDRLGGSKTIRVDVRVVAATSKDLKALTEGGKFQEALYYRLNVVPVRMPPLRERKGDIALLIDFFLDKFSRVYGRPAQMNREARDLLAEYCFPGNVRELENLIHRLVALAETATIGPRDLPAEYKQAQAQRINLEKDSLYRSLHTLPEDMVEVRRRRREINRLLAEQERHVVERLVAEADGNLTEAASRLGVHRITLHRMLKRRGDQSR